MPASRHATSSGRAPLAEVTETMITHRRNRDRDGAGGAGHALIGRYGTPRNGAGEEQKLIVLGMGKLGGRELNVSSDIDLIFVYPEDGDTDVRDGAKSISNFEFFTRLGRQLIAAIGEITGDGQVFRVDMRLRPNGDSGPLVCSFDMLENYFITQGREWERYAWIKARPLSGDRLDELEKIRRPFVFRKYLDFGTINAMRDLHAQIRREVARKDMATNIKLGPGGIREIEFIAQVFQLIRGGRDAQLADQADAAGAAACWPSAASSTSTPWSNSPPPTNSCASSNTACNISTTRRRRTCRSRRKTRPSSPAPWASPISRRWRPSSTTTGRTSRATSRLSSPTPMPATTDRALDNVWHGREGRHAAPRNWRNAATATPMPPSRASTPSAPAPATSR